MERRRYWAWLLLLAIAVPSHYAGADEAVKKPTDDDYELYQIFADTLDQVERNYVKDVSRRELMEAAIHGVLSKLDPYSNYISPEDISRFKTSVENQFGGIGIQIGVDEDGQLKIISPLIGTPAYRAGLEAGDAILEIDGKGTEGLRIDEAVKRLKGDAGTKVVLTVRHAGSNESESVAITREWVHVETVLGDRRKPDDNWDFMLDHDKHIGYIRISAFSRDTAQDLKKARIDLQNQSLKGLIVDLRFNPGGLLTSAIEVSDLFVSSGKIVSTEGRNTPPRSWEAQKEGTFEGFPMAVLVNHYSASASEILSACLQDHKRAVVIGERTWGKGSVQNVIELEGGKSALKLTTASYHRPSGKNIHRFPDAKESDEWGVMPDPGFDVHLNMGQTRRLIDYRHDRDIVLGKHSKAAPSKNEQASAAPAADSKETGAKPLEPKTESSTTEPPKTEPPKPSEAEQKSEPAHAEKKPDVAEASKKEAAQPFVDTQMQKAVDYLTQELARPIGLRPPERPQRMKKLLLLESTCDETAAAVVTDELEVLSSVVASQEHLHERYGGVVPEIASRAHVECILPVIDEALKRAAISIDQLDAVAVANTPGLAGSLLVGLAAAKALAVARGLPLVAVNHLQAHIYACRLAAGHDVFPCLGLIVSGGHTSLYRCSTPLEFELLGGTIDDAAGEAFDKVASMLGLPFPGGPSIEKAARQGNRRAVQLPRPLFNSDALDFSFSGLKTAVRYRISPPGTDLTHAKLAPAVVADLAASFQEAVVDCLVGKTLQAVERTQLNVICVGGGVAANSRLRERLGKEVASRGLTLHIPPLRLCTDNAVMGAIAVERLKAGLVENLDLDVFPGLERQTSRTVSR